MASIEQFIEDNRERSADRAHLDRMTHNNGKYQHYLQRGKFQYEHLELARQRAAFLKWKSIENLDKYLLEFETAFTRNGGKVLWAPDTASALGQIGEILQKQQIRKAVKSKSMLAEEIGLNTFLQKSDIELLETDLGEFIQQLSGEKPYHMVTPAMHKSREDIAALFRKHLGTHEASSVEELVDDARKRLRHTYREAGISFSGANFLIAENGGIAITENEGNARMAVAFSPIHIVLAGIEKIIPTLADLDTFWPLLSTFGTGQKLTAYNSILQGPRLADENDGPQEVYVVLIDNGRTELMGMPEQREALSCIKCGACANVCPVFQHIGGHGYQTTYSGPIGAVITPYLKPFKDYYHLAYASPLCGACTDICPVKIDLHQLLLKTRHESVKRNMHNTLENYVWRYFSKMMLDRRKMNQKAKFKNLFLKMYFGKKWGPRRELPLVAEKSFNQLWREKHAGS